MNELSSTPPAEEQPLSAADYMMQMALGTPAAPPDSERAAVRASTPATLDERRQRIADGLRGNKRMASGLDKATRLALADWIDAAAGHIAAATAGLSDAEAEGIIQSRVRAMRRVVYGLKDAARGREPATPELLDALYQQATVVYGDDFCRPDDAQTAAFCERWNRSDVAAAARLAQVRRLIEPGREAAEGESHDPTV